MTRLPSPPGPRAAALAMLALGLACGGACGGSIGSYAGGVTGVDGGPPVSPDMAASDAGPSSLACLGPGAPPPPSPLPSCKTNPPRECVTDLGPTGDACLRMKRFSSSVVQALAACGMCGDVLIGVSSGCVTEVIPNGPSGLDAGAADAGALAPPIACARLSLVGATWTCAPPDGWVRISFGVCLTP